MLKEVKIIIAIGSNVNAAANLETAEEALRKTLKDVRFSRCVTTTPIGIQSDKFLNELAFAHTNHGMPQIERSLKYIEKMCGSTAAEHRRGIVKMDLDLLLFENNKQHPKDWNRSYIKRLLKDDPYI
jgi:2-amino-4-hydroxy-6-hydroxymethyldihydropteridine diphosphokinase